MRFKQFFLLLLLAGCTPVEAQIKEAVLQSVRKQFGEDERKYSLGEIKILSRDEARALTAASFGAPGSATPGFLYHEVRNASGKWIVMKNLVKDFNEYTNDAGNEEEFLQRLANRVFERFGPGLQWTVKPGLRKNITVRHTENQIIGSMSVRFAYPKTEKGQSRGEYIEDFAFQNGAWELMGGGSLIDVLQ